MQAVLAANWGGKWQQRFEPFSFTAIAAASIGQVHRAKTLDGRDLASKIQYPGVRKSISSDVNNLATLLRLSGLLPSTLDIAPLLLEAKRQLRQEADYQAEGDRIVRLLVRLLFRELFEFALMQTDPNFANYRYDTLTGQLILLDFGPFTRKTPPRMNADPCGK